jgi:hypothetical protein
MFRLFRIIPILLIIVMLITILRSVIGVVMKLFGNMVSGPGGASGSATGAKRPPIQVSGELHRDPVCGTFVAGSTAFQRQDAGQTFYYCSENCRSQHALVSR